MKDTLLSFLLGTVLGGAFGVARLPIPAPKVFAGVAGIIGIWAGYGIAMYLGRKGG